MGGEVAEVSASQAKTRVASKPPPPRLPLPRRASNSAPLPPPAAKCPRQRREKQEVKAGAKGQTEPGGPGRRHSRSAWRPRVDSRSRPTAPRPGALPRGPWNRPGEGSPGYRDGCDPFLPPWPVTARPRPRPQAGTLRPGRAPFCGAGAPRFHCCGSLPPLPERTRTRAHPDGAARAGHPPPTRAPRSQVSRDPRGGVSPQTGTGQGRQARDSGAAALAGSLGPRTHLSFSAGALAALRGVSSAAGQGHAPDVSTQATFGWVPAEVGGTRR